MTRPLSYIAAAFMIFLVGCQSSQDGRTRADLTNNGLNGNETQCTEEAAASVSVTLNVPYSATSGLRIEIRRRSDGATTVFSGDLSSNYFGGALTVAGPFEQEGIFDVTLSRNGSVIATFPGLRVDRGSCHVNGVAVVYPSGS